MLPAYVTVTTPERGVPALAWVALVVGLAAVALELVADVQMHRFVARRNPGDVMDSGLWGWSRHRNYVGEVGFWLSVLLFGLAAAPHLWWWMPVGALAMLAMFIAVSIPMMEERSSQRRPGYSDVIQRVSRLVPRPPRSAEN